MSRGLTIGTEHGQKSESDAQRSRNVSIRPGVGAAGPIQGQKKQGASGDEEQRSDRVAGPEVLFQRHLGIVGPSSGMVEEQQAEESGQVEGGLHPKDVAPARRAGIRDAARTKDADSGKE